MSCKMLTQQQAKDPRCSSSAASGVQAPCDRLTLWAKQGKDVGLECQAGRRQRGGSERSAARRRGARHAMAVKAGKYCLFRAGEIMEANQINGLI